MSYNVSLWCGCVVYVSCHPETGLAHTRIVESRGTTCPVRNHEVGARLWLWELLPVPGINGDPSADPRSSPAATGSMK